MSVTRGTWYCPESVLDYNLVLVDLMGERDYKRFKIVYNLIVTVTILVISGFAINEGAEPTTIGAMAIAGILVVNGVSLSEWLAVRHELNHRKRIDERED